MFIRIYKKMLNYNFRSWDEIVATLILYNNSTVKLKIKLLTCLIIYFHNLQSHKFCTTNNFTNLTSAKLYFISNFTWRALFEFQWCHKDKVSYMRIITHRHFHQHSQKVVFEIHVCLNSRKLEERATRFTVTMRLVK